MRPRATSLFHFTSFESLKQILRRLRFLPRYCREDIRWLGIAGRDYAAYPMTSFCDIPLSRVAEHTEAYGNYGLGLTKEWGLDHGLTPVLYGAAKSVVPKVANFLFRSHEIALSGSTVEARTQSEDALVSMLSLTKPLAGRMHRRGLEIEKDFLQESEWRYVPNLGSDRIVLEDKFHRERSTLDSQAAEHPLTFSAADLRYVFVSREDEVVQMLVYLEKEPECSDDDRRLMCARITSIEALSRDV